MSRPPAGPTKQEIAAMMADPRAFRDSLLIETDDGPIEFADVVDRWQDQDFDALDPAWLRLTSRSSEKARCRAWLERPRGHSKTTDVAVMVTWALLSSCRKISGIVASGDKEQAKLLRDAIDTLVRLNPWLRLFIDVQVHVVVNKVTNSEAEIISSDAPTSYGLTPDFVICDELTHWPSRELWDSLFSSAAKRSRCLLLVITNAGFEESWQWPLREAVRQDASWYFHHLDGPKARWITAERLDEQRRLLPPVSYRRLWLNVWATGEGDAINPELLREAVRLEGPSYAADPELLYVAGLDLGLRRDSAVFLVLGKHVGRKDEQSSSDRLPAGQPISVLTDLGILENREKLTGFSPRSYVPGTGRLKLAAIRIWKPAECGGTVKIADVRQEICGLHSVFRFASVSCDPWQSCLLVEELQSSGVPARTTNFTRDNLKSMAEATMSAFTEGLIDLFGSPELLADLSALRIVERNYGVRLESPRGVSGGTAHGDTATALSLALHEARFFNQNIQTELRSVVHWPPIVP